ncbi:MAG: Sensor histidine kinase BtsS [Gammaproteobacteria bacterium]|nr:Sensor histidine kinase BtsS [Gammaproteobacteria bacterium]
MRPKTELSTTAIPPNFGSANIGVRIVLVAQCLAIVLAMARNDSFDQPAWNDFVLMTTFAQSVAIGSILALKLVSRSVQKMTPLTGGIFVFFLLTIVAVIVSEGIIFTMYRLGLLSGRWPEWHGTMVIRILVISAIINALALRYAFVYHRTRIDSKTREQDRLQVLHAHIQPHFLFNSMNSVASLIRPDPERAERALHDLADVFRVTLRDARKMVPITEEIELARQYLDIEKLRLGDRLQINWSNSKVPHNALIPSLTLQPLIENAIYHGVEPSSSGGVVELRMWSEGSDLLVLITNPIPETANPAQEGARQRKGNQMAMNNVRERFLNHHFHGKAGLRNYEQSGRYHTILKMPVITGESIVGAGN